MTDGSLTVATTTNHELRFEPPSATNGLLSACVRAAPGWPAGEWIAYACAEPAKTTVKADPTTDAAHWGCWVDRAHFSVLEADARRIQAWLAALSETPPAPADEPMPTDGLGYGPGNPAPVPHAPRGQL